MIKRILAKCEDFWYRSILKNLLKTSKLGHGFVVTGAEAGTNFEHIYNNRSQGSFIIGKFIDRALLNLPAVKSTRGRKDDIKKVLWNEINNNKQLGVKTHVLDLASGGARYLREFVDEHHDGSLESICIDKDKSCVRLGEDLSKQEGLKNIKFVHGDLFRVNHLKSFAKRIKWKPNVVIASGLLIYFNDQTAEKIIREIYNILDSSGIIIFTSYEQLNTRKLMRKTMATSSGEEWVLYYRKPEFWRSLLHRIGFKNIFIFRDQWQMNNICTARK